MTRIFCREFSKALSRYAGDVTSLYQTERFFPSGAVRTTELNSAIREIQRVQGNLEYAWWEMCGKKPRESTR